MFGWFQSLVIAQQLLGKLSAIDYVDAASIGLVVSPCFLKDEAAKGVSAFATNETLKAEQEAAMDVVTDFMANEVPNSIAWSASMGDNAARRNYIKFLSAFLNLEGTANTVASNLAANYECVKSASVAASGATKPVMAFVEYQAPSDYNNQTAIYQINMPAYKAEFIADVGAVAPVTKTTKFTDSAAFLEAIKNVEYLVDETFIGTSSFDDLLTTYKLTSGSALPFVAKKQVYRTDKLQNAEGWTGEADTLLYKLDVKLILDFFVTQPGSSRPLPSTTSSSPTLLP